MADEFDALLLEMQAEGIPFKIKDLGDGSMAIVIVKPEDRAIVGPLIRKALPAPTEPEAPKKTTKRKRRKKSDPPALPESS